MTRITIMILVCFILFFHTAFAKKRANNPYTQCIDKQKIKDVNACLDKVGRIEWYPYKSPDSCIISKEVLEVADRKGWKLSWKVLFMNERCRRLGEPFYKRSGQP